MAQPPVVTAEMARSHRLRAHHLAAPLPPGAYCEAAAACGLQNSPPGAFETALFARVQGASPAGIRRALYEEKSLLQAWSLRGAPAVFPTRDSDVFLCALQGAHSEQPWVYTRGIGLALGRLSMTVQQLWPLVRGAAQQCLGRQAIVGKPALDAAVAALVLPQLPVEKQPVWNSPSPYGRPDVQTLGGAVASFLLRPCAFERLVVFGRRQGALPVFTSPEAWLGAPLPPPRPDAALRLARRFVHCYGPTTPAAFQSWLGASPAQARRMWAAVAPETRPVSLAGRTAYVLAQDMPGLLAAAPAQPQLLLLGPHDPYLDVHGPREKALLLPDAARHKAVWQTVSNPGVLLQAGAVAGVWRQSAQGKGLALRFTLFAPLSSAGRAQVQALAQRYAAFRGQHLAACTLEE